MNKLLILFFLSMPILLFGMGEETICKRVASSAQKNDVKKDLTFEQADRLIESRLWPNQNEKYMLKAFAITYLRREGGKTYNQMKAALDDHYNKAIDSKATLLEVADVKSFVDLMKKVIDNWDTARPEHIFKYCDTESNLYSFFTRDCFLGLKDPRVKDKQQ